MLRDRIQQVFALVPNAIKCQNGTVCSDTVSEKSWQEINISRSALQSPCKVQEGLGKAPQNTICSQHLKQQEVPELLSRKSVSLQGNFKAPFADMCDPKIAFPSSLTPAELCYTEPLDPGAWLGTGWGARRARLTPTESPPSPLALHGSTSRGALQALAGGCEGTRDTSPTFTA